MFHAGKSEYNPNPLKQTRANQSFFNKGNTKIKNRNNVKDLGNAWAAMFCYGKGVKEIWQINTLCQNIFFYLKNNVYIMCNSKAENADK